METDKFDLENVLSLQALDNELDLEKANALAGKLRWMAKEDPLLIPTRKHLLKIIRDYEEKNWLDEDAITDEQVRDSDLAEELVALESRFIQQRKALIKDAIGAYGINQQDLGKILGHRKNYMSQLMNGITSFSKNDLMIIHRIFKIELEFLFPPFIKDSDAHHIKETLLKLNKPDLKLTKVDLKWKLKYKKAN